MRYPGLVLRAALASVAIAGCDSGDSSDSPDRWGSGDINTRDMRIEVSVKVADDAMAEVTVALNYKEFGPNATPNYLLTKGDELSACVGAVCTSLTRNSSARVYKGTLPYVGGSAYTISLSRQVDASAPSSVVTMPGPLAILAPPAGLPVTDGQMVTVQWSPLNDVGSTTVESDTHCIHENRATSDRRWGGQGFYSSIAGRSDTGSAIASVDEMVIGAWAFHPNPPLPAAPVRRCDIVLEVRQGRAGTVDSAFARGSIGASATRFVTLDYTPSRP